MLLLRAGVLLGALFCLSGLLLSALLRPFYLLSLRLVSLLALLFAADLLLAHLVNYARICGASGGDHNSAPAAPAIYSAHRSPQQVPAAASTVHSLGYFFALHLRLILHF